MIRLIATDMDGTLLDDEKKMPEEFGDVIAQLKVNKIDFAVASGRSYATLKEQFCPYLDDMTFICDNGAYVVKKQQIVDLSIIKTTELKELIEVCRSFDAKILLCGMNGTYHEYFGSENQEKEIAQYYVNQVLVEDNLNVEDDIFKLAIYDEQGAENHAYVILKQHFGDRFQYQASGKFWVDIMNPGVNKGTALIKLQKDMHITREETMAFGDYLNDYELLAEAGESFAMANAHDRIKQIAKHQTYSNNENGVIRAIKQYVLQ